MQVIRLDGRGDAFESDAAVRLVLQWLRLNARQHRAAPLLVLVGMRLLADQVFVAAPAMRHQRRQVALRARWKEQGRFEAEPLRHHRLQAVDGRVIPIDIVAHRGVRHGGAHAGCGLRDRIAAQIDRSLHSDIHVSCSCINAGE